MASIVVLGSKDHLSITGDPQAPWLAAMICQGQQPDLNIILWGYKDLSRLSNRVYPLVKFDHVTVKEDRMLNPCLSGG
jgi:hypothetical protein